MVQSVDNVANIRYSCVSKRKKGRETKENLEKFKLEGENGAGGGPFQSIKKDTFVLAFHLDSLFAIRRRNALELRAAPIVKYRCEVHFTHSEDG